MDIATGSREVPVPADDFDVGEGDVFVRVFIHEGKIRLHTGGREGGSGFTDATFQEVFDIIDNGIKELRRKRRESENDK